jgi:RHS repeat-associated protein
VYPTVPAPGVVFKYKLQRCQLDSGSACDWENNQMLYAAPSVSQTQMVWTPGSNAATNAAGPNFGGLNSFRVTVCANDVCESAWTYSSNLGIRPPLTTAQVPIGSQVGSFQITWPAASAASSYQVERGIGSPVVWTNIGSTSATAMTVTPPANGDYRFRVTAINSYGNRGVGPESALVNYTQPTVCTPGVPENFAANVSNGISTTGNFTVSWSASGCSTVQYLITRKINGAYDQLYQVPATSALQLTQSGLPNALYEYIISACKAPSKSTTTCSPDSAALPVQVQLPNGLTPPQNVRVPISARQGFTYNVTWNAVAGAHHYRIREEVVGIIRVTDNITALTQPFTSNQVETYTYVVFACSATNECSAPSTPVSIRIDCVGMGCTGRATFPSTLTYVHTDQLGSPVAESDVSGTITVRFRYEPYGQSLESTPAQGPSYTGHVYDAASGLIYMQQRYYDPVIGRFLSTDPDPVNGLGTNFNRYNYAGNNPYKYVDPDGRCVEDLCVGEAILIVTALTSVAIATNNAFENIKRDAQQNQAKAQTAAAQQAATQEDETANDAESGDSGTSGNTNPYNGPVDSPVILVDNDGNAIPVGTGEQVKASPNGNFQQVLDSEGKPTGTRLDKGGHPKQSDPKARAPHGHRPGVTDESGNPHLPINPPKLK